MRVGACPSVGLLVFLPTKGDLYGRLYGDESGTHATHSAPHRNGELAPAPLALCVCSRCLRRIIQMEHGPFTWGRGQRA